MPYMNENLADHFEAIVLAAGRGSRMTALTDHVPKPLLPVANLPLFWYPLNTLARSGFTTAILVVDEEVGGVDIQRMLADGSLPPLPGLSITVVATATIPVKPTARESTTDSADSDGEGMDEDDELGTADVLRHLLFTHSKQQQSLQQQKKHLLIVGGDLVTEMRLDGLLAQHLSSEAALTCCLADSRAQGGPSPGQKECKRYRDFMVLSNRGEALHQPLRNNDCATTPSSSIRRLLYLCEEEDYGDNQQLSAHLFKRFPDVSLTASEKDVHLYAVKRTKLVEALQLPNSSTSQGPRQDIVAALTSLKADVIPLLLEKQYTHDGSGEDTASTTATNDGCFAYFPARTGEQQELGAVVIQCNTVAAYFEANKAMQPLVERGVLIPKMGTSNPSMEDYKAQGANVVDSAIADGVELGKKANIKKSVIGKNCRIGQQARIDSSLLMEGVTVGNGAQIRNSILCSGAEVGEKMELQLCIVATGHRVTEGRRKHANEVLCEEKAVNFYDE